MAPVALPRAGVKPHSPSQAGRRSNVNDLFGQDKIADSIQMLKEFEPPEGYYLAFSGGKDSCVIKQLAIEAGVKFDAHYSNTTIDLPDTIYFMRKHHPDVIWDNPKKPFLSQLATRGFPLRQARWCCGDYKENGGKGRTIILGIRGAESIRRSKRRNVEFCTRRGSRLISPIFHWSDREVWKFIWDRKLPYCKLYDMGFERLGCFCCPMQKVSEKNREMELYPQMEKAFRLAFKKLYAHRVAQGKPIKDRWSNSDAMFDWWVTGKEEQNLEPLEIMRSNDN